MATKPKSKKTAKTKTKPKAQAKPKASAKATPKPKPKPKPKLKPRPKAKPVATRTERARATPEAFEAAVARAEQLPAGERLARLEQLREAVTDQLEWSDAQPIVQRILHAEGALAHEARNDAAVLAGLIDLVERFEWRDDLVHVLATVPHDDVYALVRHGAAAQLDLPSHDTRTSWLFALAELAHVPRFANDARALLLGGFAHYTANARDTGKLVNAVGFGALAHAIAHLGDPQASPVLRDAFRAAAGHGDLDAHYELNVTCGPLALALAGLGFVQALPELDTFLTEYADRYEGDDFVMQVRYARWLLAREPAAALAYITNREHTKGLAYAAAALADLHHIAGYEAVAARAKSLAHPVAREALAEALARLARQTTPPAVEDRMIWLFGRRSPTEQALGEASDNVFVQRAIERTQQAELGIVREADESAPDD